MVKTICVKTNNKLLFMNELRTDLALENIHVCAFLPSKGFLQTRYVNVYVVSDIFSACIQGRRFDRAFYFSEDDRMNYRLIDPCAKYEGTPLGYIIKTEAEETIRNEQRYKTQIRTAVLNSMYGTIADSHSLKIQNVIFNDPATIVFWSDGTKTVVKCQSGDVFDPEKGLAMAISKKALGNKSNYCNELKRWLPTNNTTTILFDGTKLQKAIYAANHLPYAVEDIRKYKEKIQKAYDGLVQLQNNRMVPSKRLDDILRYLSDALEV